MLSPLRGTLLAAIILLTCGCPADTTNQPASTAGRATTEVTLPDGTIITAELSVTREEQKLGLMFRPELPKNGGMLFVFTDEYPQPFWMYQTLIPLDLIWLDANKRVVEVVVSAPPCKSLHESECPNYGGSVPSRYVLEIASGTAEKHGVKQGVQLSF